MAITMASIIFLNFHATPIIRLLIRIISDIAAYYNYISDFNEILYSSKLKDAEYNGYNYFQNSYATPLITLLIGIIKVVRAKL